MIMSRSMSPFTILFLVFLTHAITISISLGHGNSVVLCIGSERQALLSFKHDLIDSSNRLSSWVVVDEDCCKWAGIVCDNLTGHVKELNLSNDADVALMSDAEYEAWKRSMLKGKISSSLLDLKHLSHLDLSYNNFSGVQIPSFIGSLVSLNYLNLSHAGFEGNIPHQLGNLSSLHHLGLQGGHSYDGALLYVDNLHWLHGLSSLEHLDLSSVNLSKASESLTVVNNLPSLIELHLSYCELHHIPSLHDVNFTSLSILDISENNFNSFIPKWVFSLHSLITLDLDSSNFEGPIPCGFQNMSSLRHLDLSFNSFNSTIPNCLYRFGSVHSLNLRYNNLKGVISSAIGNLSSLVSLDLSGNELEREIPRSMGNLSSFVSLDLSSNKLEGEIPTSLGNLSSLVSLYLSGNELEREIPRTMGNLCSLVSLDLSGNKLEGEIPTSLGNLFSLVSLDLSGNELEREIPRSMGNMSSLASLDLSYNKLEGEIPTSLGNLSSLVSLYLSNNELEGEIPRSMGNLSSLVSLHLSKNKLEGEIPSSIGNLSSLASLDLSNNELEGELPKSMGNLCNLGGKLSEVFESFSGCLTDVLEALDLWINHFSGHLTDQIGEFKNLSYLDLSGNLISGPIPSSLEQWSSLRSLYISDNQLNGSLPGSLGGLSNLETLDISSNGLEGVVSEVHFANLTNLTYLSAEGNLLTLIVSPSWIPPFHLQILDLSSWNLGPQFPTWLKSQKSLQHISLSNTKIQDYPPFWFWNLSIGYLSLSNNHISGLLPHLSSNITSVLDLSNNSFFGNLSHFLCDSMYGTYSLNILHLEGNLLSGEIPNCWSNQPLLELLNLGSNKLVGKIPHSMGYLRYLQSLHLHNNSFFGEIPLSLQNCTELVTLDLGVNAFTGSIPAWMGINLSKLKVLVLRSNKFIGRIPSELCHLTSLQIMDVASNNFSGTIPRCFNNFTAMTTKHNSSEQFIDFRFYSFIETALLWIKGRENQYDNILSLVASLDLSNNNLLGEIPKELTSLVALISLNLSRNHLTGRIPEKIGDMVLMEALDLSRNWLSGKIPPSMSSLNFLSYLNLSNNNLSGEIPLSTQLQSLNASSFVGNNLCGPPLTKSCVPIGTTPSTGYEGKKVGSRAEVDGFYLGLALGFVVGFWGICGPLLYSKSWRFSYYRFLDDMKHKIWG